MSKCLDEKQASLDKNQQFLNDNQRSVLKQWFAKDPYPKRDTIRKLSDTLGVDKRKVYNWFNNERNRLKKNKIPLPAQSKSIILLLEIFQFGFGYTLC